MLGISTSISARFLLEYAALSSAAGCWYAPTYLCLSALRNDEPYETLFVGLMNEPDPLILRVTLVSFLIRNQKEQEQRTGK